MNYKYKANRKHITIQLLIITIIGAMGIALILRNGFKAREIPLITSIVGCYILILYQQFKDYKLVVNIMDDGLDIIKKGEHYHFDWKSIDCLKWGGLRGVPSFESLIVQSNGNKILLNRNIVKYREVWVLIVKQVKKQNPKAIIDPHLITKFLN